MQQRDVLTVEEAARRLRISRTAAYELIRTTGRLGPVPVIRLGRKIVIPRRALERVLEGEIAADQ